MRLVITIKAWKRHATLRATLRSIESASKYTGLDVVVVIAGSEGEASRSIAAEFAAEYVECPNLPLSLKADTCLRKAAELDPDYVMILGSDDLVSDLLLASYEPHIEGGVDAIGWDDCFFLADGRLYYWPGYDKELRDDPIGAGVAVSREMCEAIGWQQSTHPDNRNLDTMLRCRMTLARPDFSEVRLSMAEEGEAIVDAKDELSITGLDRYHGLVEAVGATAAQEAISWL